MTGSRRHLAAPQCAILATLVAALLLAGFTGHAGVQVIDGALAARLFKLHGHGVPGEAAWIAAHGTWEGFVPDHCHADAGSPPEQSGPDDVAAAAALAGAIWCATTDTELPRSPSLAVVAGDDVPALREAVIPVLLPPPR